MKKSLLLICILFALILTIHAQAPQAFKYQAVIRDNSGQPMVNETVVLRTSIVSLSNNEVYSETHTENTDPFGMVSLVIGNGSILNGNFGGIDWSADLYLLKIEYDQGGGNYITMGTSPLMSVPYALYAANSGNPGTPGNGIESTDDNGNGTFTINYTDGSSFTTTDLTGPQGPAGANGAPGPTGNDGQDGVGIVGATILGNNELLFALTNGQELNVGTVVGPQGLQGAPGPQGVQGLQGEQGVQGLTGEPGADGPQGTGISGVFLNGFNELIITLEDGQIMNVGNVQGPDGATGPHGPAG